MKISTDIKITDENSQEWELLKNIASSYGISHKKPVARKELYDLVSFDIKLAEISLCMGGSLTANLSTKVDFKEFLLYLIGLKTSKKEIGIITDKYDVIVNEEGIDFGCQFVGKDDAEKIFKAWREVNG